MLQDQVSEQLMLISSLQMRLDEQRLRAEQVEKQTKTSLEVRIYDLENEVQSLQEIIYQRDKTIKQLNNSIEQTKQRLLEREKEIEHLTDESVQEEYEEEIERLRTEITILKTKINTDAQSAQILPNLVDNILSDKNADIEKLKEELNETKKQLSYYSSLNLDSEQLRTLSQLTNSNKSIGNILSLLEMEEPDRIRRMESDHESIENSNALFKRNVNETTVLGKSSFDISGIEPDFSNIEPEISEIESKTDQSIHKVNREIEPMSFSNMKKMIDSDVQKSSLKHVHFDDKIEEISTLKKELRAKDEVIREYSDRLKVLNELEVNIGNLQDNLEHTEDALKKATETFEREQGELVKLQQELQMELVEKKMHLQEKSDELSMLKEDCKRKDHMYIELVKENRELEKQVKELDEIADKYKKFESIIAEKNREVKELEGELVKAGEIAGNIKKLEELLEDKDRTIEALKKKCENLEAEIANKNVSLEGLKKLVESQKESLKDKDESLQEKSETLQEKVEIIEQKDKVLREKEEITSKLEKELKNKTFQLEFLSGEYESLKEKINSEGIKAEGLGEEKQENLTDFQLKIKKLQDLLTDRECELEILNEDNTRYQNELAKLESKVSELNQANNNDIQLQLMKNRKEMAEKNLEIVKLQSNLDDAKKEIEHLQEFLNEKDKIIDQVKLDSESLKINLEAIQNKMQENGNILDLKNKLQDQYEENERLREEINSLKLDEVDEKDMGVSIDEITGRVKKELDVSAQLDSSILIALSSSDDANFDELESDVDLLKQALFKEKKRNKELNGMKASLQADIRDLEVKLEKEQENTKRLHFVLESEKKKSESIQLEDANLIERMRLRLESVLENEAELEKLIEEEKIKREELERENFILKQRPTNVSSSSNSNELTEYKSLPTTEMMELNRLRNDWKNLIAENETLKGEVKNLKNAKNEGEASIKYLNEMLSMKMKEVEKLEKKYGDVQEEAYDFRRKWLGLKADLEEKNRVIENSRILMVSFFLMR